ncbi:MAG: hypothetical protein JOY62_19280 [Acidobacteriaceae bacterium]|nr:hypothetical protein [Acidobacteriaceae bacterium]MBV9782109.1 hypothetical protein [Acidobacteriaceae bacterium]
MPRKSIVDERYEALMFAKSPEAARSAAVQLARSLLGDKSFGLPLEEALRQCCRILRPARDGAEQRRFEDEFVELGIWPSRPETQNPSEIAA